MSIPLQLKAGDEILFRGPPQTLAAVVEVDRLNAKLRWTDAKGEAQERWVSLEWIRGQLIP
jgi:hypothetical protein